MSIYQVEEFYIYINNKDIDFDAAKAACDEHGFDFVQDCDTAVIETFNSEGEAEEFHEIIKENASI